ncbi:MAG: biotin/lipoyl-containing protein, partial [Sphingomonadales bacterium]
MGTFTMPSLGADMEAGTLVEWLKKPGEEVKRGDIVAVVETEKGAIEVEIFEDGRIERLLVEAGAKVPVGTALALVVGKGGEAPAEVQPPPAAQAPPPPVAEAVPRPPSVAAAPAPGAAVRASPAARRAAREKGIDLAGLTGT